MYGSCVSAGHQSCPSAPWIVQSERELDLNFKVNSENANCHLLEPQQMAPNQSKRSKWQPRHTSVWSMIPRNGNNGTDPLESIEVVWMGSWSNSSHPLRSWLDQHCPRCSSERGYAHRPPEIDLEWAYSGRSRIVVSDIRGIRLLKRRHPSCSWRLWWSFGSVSRETRCATQGRNWKENRHVKWEVLGQFLIDYRFELTVCSEDQWKCIWSMT